MIRYQVHGLSLVSQLPLPPLLGLPQPSGAQQPTDVFVSAHPSPKQLQTPELSRRYYQKAPGEVLMHAPRVGKLHILDGRHIRYELAAPERAGDLAAHILGSGFAIIHQQRGNVVLHGSSISLNGKAFLICGASGAGKSTITAHLLEQGGHTLGDDVSFVGDAPNFLVYPGPPSTKLATDTFAALGSGGDLVRQGTCPSGKGIFDTSMHFMDEPAPLGGIIVIEPKRAARDVVTKRLAGAEAQAVLHYNTFRKRCIASDVAQALFSKRSKLAQSIPIWQITRPKRRDSRGEIVKLVTELIARSGMLPNTPYELPVMAAGVTQ